MTFLMQFLGRRARVCIRECDFVEARSLAAFWIITRACGLQGIPCGLRAWKTTSRQRSPRHADRRLESFAPRVHCEFWAFGTRLTESWIRELDDHALWMRELADRTLGSTSCLCLVKGPGGPGISNCDVTVSLCPTPGTSKNDHRRAGVRPGPPLKRLS